jgi:hypothetical protein
MQEDFLKNIRYLEPSFQILLKMTPVKVNFLPPIMPKSGIYLLSEGSNHLYAGRGNNLRIRLQQHSRPSSGHNSAPFAFRLAREATGKIQASYTPDGSRKHLEDLPEFKKVFLREKERVNNMDIRFVEEGNPLRQALLEIYVAICLKTKFNDFNTH